MQASENIEETTAIAVAVAVLVLFTLVVVFLYRKLLPSKYSPFRFVNRLLDDQTHIRMTTPMSPEAAVRHIKSKVTRIGVPVLMSARLVGRVADLSLSLRLHRQFSNNTFSPIFDGVVIQENGRTVLEGTYQLHKYARYFMKFWFGFIILWSAIGIPAGMIQLIAGNPEGAPFVVMPFLMFGLGILLVRFGRHLGDKDRDLITEKLAEAIEGTVGAT